MELMSPLRKRPAAEDVFIPHRQITNAWKLRDDELKVIGANILPTKNFVPGVSTLPTRDGEDTLVFFTPAYLGAMDPVDCSGNAIVPCVMTVPSIKLVASGSSFFAKQFEPRFQQRLMRRHKITTLPAGIEWLLDLTPPEDGDEIGPQIVILSLTPGLVKWAAAGAALGVPEILITGHDDACHCDLHSLSSIMQNPHPGAAYRQIESSWPEYSQTRHLRSLVRLMLVAKGEDLVIDSAPRLWTIVGLAHLLGCENMIQDEVFRWLADDKNRNFIVSLPEEALSIGYKMKLAYVIRSSFIILVNELALDLLAKNKDEDQGVNGMNIPQAIPDAKIPEYTVFGRKRNMDVLDDDLQSMLQEAARRWADKVREAVENVSSKPDTQTPDIYTIFNRLEWRHLKADCELIRVTPDGVPDGPTQHEMMEMHDNIVRIARETWTKHIDTGLEKSLFNVPSHDRIQSYEKLAGKRMDSNKWVDMTLGLSVAQRFLCSKTWRIFCGHGHTWAHNGIGAKLRVAIDETQPNEPQPLWAICAEFHAGMTKINPVLDHFDLNEFSLEVESATFDMCSGWLDVENDLLRGLDISNLMVLNLEHGIFAMLPIYADGKDDETGAVYGMDVPDAMMGPVGPGPSFRTGLTLGSVATSFAPSEATYTGTDTTTTAEGAITANASRDATNTGTTVDAGLLRVRPGLAPSEGGSIASGSSVDHLGSRVGRVDLGSVDEEAGWGGHGDVSASTQHHSEFGVESMADDSQCASVSSFGINNEHNKGNRNEDKTGYGNATSNAPAASKVDQNADEQDVVIVGTGAIDVDSSSDFEFAESDDEFRADDYNDDVEIGGTSTSSWDLM